MPAPPPFGPAQLADLRRALTLPPEERTQATVGPAVEALKRLDMFQQMPEESVLQMAQLVTLRRFRGGTVLFEQGSVGETMFIVASGNVQIRVMRADDEATGAAAEHAAVPPPAEKPQWGHVTARPTGTNLPLRVIDAP